MRASGESGGSDLLQCSQVGLSSSMVYPDLNAENTGSVGVKAKKLPVLPAVI